MEECMLVYHLKLSIWCPIRQRLCRKIRRKKYHDSIIKSLFIKIWMKFFLHGIL